MIAFVLGNHRIRDKYVRKVHKKRAFLMYVENLEMDNSLKYVLFSKVSGQITSNTLWKKKRK